MRVVVQRVARASVAIDDRVVAAIDRGLVVLVAIVPTDTHREVSALVTKLTGLRMFADEDGRMNRSISEIGGSILVVSQFTLAADLRRGRRPSFTEAAEPSLAEPMVHAIVTGFGAAGVPASSGVFGAMMQVSLVNDGPVTFVLDVEDGRVR